MSASEQSPRLSDARRAAESSTDWASGTGWASILLVAALLSGANAIKPLVVDDTAYVEFARQVAERPTDPYGFEIFWNAAPEPANHVLAPPVLLYWHAASLALVGEHPVLWKLSLLPFALLLAYALDGSSRA